jgi:endonuclease/exonuclease/phosphatase family metal-dependent hydrolase
MKIITWNTFLAPTMWDRHNRKNLLKPILQDWFNRGVDIIALQEVNSYMTGPVSYFLYWVLFLAKIHNPYILHVLDIFASFEGYLLPIFCIDISTQIENECKEIGYNSIIRSPRPYYTINGGLMIICRNTYAHKIDIEYLDADVFQIPSVLSAVVEFNDHRQINISTCHLISVLDSNVHYTYRVLNILSSIFNKPSHVAQRKNISSLIEHIDRNDIDILLGDFNIHYKTDMYQNISDGLQSIARNLQNTYTGEHSESTHFDINYIRHNRIGNIKHIDYIFSTFDLNHRSRSSSVLSEKKYYEVSDHLPVFADIDIPI